MSAPQSALPTAPRVSWLLPVRNGMPYLPAALASIAAQTYSNWEVLAWDNGSEDGSRQELERWIPARLPGRVVTGRPLGLGASLAALVLGARGELCARIDADDINLPHRLQQQVDFLDAHPAVGLLGSNTFFIDEAGEPLPTAYTQYTRDADIRWLLRWHNAFSHPTVMFRRSLALAAGNYHDCMPYEDYDLWLRMARHCQVANSSEPLLKYRVREGSISGKQGPNYDAIDREVAALNAEWLFAGLAPAEALRRRTILDTRYQGRRRPGDFMLLHNTALRAARGSGLAPGYFVGSRYYRLQILAIARGLVRNYGWGRALCAALRRSTVAGEDNGNGRYE